MADVANAWAQSGDPCWFVAPTPPRGKAIGQSRPSVVQLLDELGHAGVRSPTIVTRSTDASFQYGTAFRRAYFYAELLRMGVPPLVPVIVSDDPDVWHAASMAAARNPMIGVLHSDEAKYYQLAGNYSACASAFVAVSRRVAASVREAIHDSRPVATIPCGVPLPSQWTKPRQPDEAFHIAWVGRIEERQKRVSDIPRIVGALLKTGAPVTLDIVGDGPDERALQEALLRLGQGDAIRLHGWRDRAYVQRVLHESDVLLLPSNFEGMPVVVMEALSQGCAVVASRTSGIEDWVDFPDSHGCLWTFAVGDVTSAARCLKECAAVASDIRRARARQMAAAEFSIEACVQRYRTLLEALPQTTWREGGRPVLRARLSELVSYPIAALRLLRLATRRSDVAN